MYTYVCVCTCMYVKEGHGNISLLVLFENNNAEIIEQKATSKNNQAIEKGMCVQDKREEKKAVRYISGQSLYLLFSTMVY